MGKLRRYFWPKTALLFYVNEERIEAAFGFFEKGGIDLVERRSYTLGEKEALTAWYEEIARTYPQTYLAAMLDTFNQGALPGCGASVFQKFGVDAALVHAVCVEEEWTAYASLVETKWFEQKFRKMTFDYLFSPFVLLYEKSASYRKEEPALFILHQKGVAYLMVLSRERMWFAHLLVVAEGREASLDEEESPMDELSFDLEMLDEEEEVAPISDSDVLGEFKEEVSESEETDEQALERLEYNLTLFEEIKEAIRRFYHDERYAHAFIERVVLFDMDEVGSDFVRYVEDELFMEAQLHAFDPIETMATLMVKERIG